MREDLYQIPLPQRTRSYSPVAHREIIEITENYLNNQGYAITNESYQVGNNGNQMIGHWRLNGGNSEMAPMIAFRNSYDKTMSLGYAIGTQVFVN